MAIVECTRQRPVARDRRLAHRDGRAGSGVTLRKGKPDERTYRFYNRQDLTPGDHEAETCKITIPADVEFFLKHPNGDYRLYKPDVVEASVPPKPLDPPAPPKPPEVPPPATTGAPAGTGDANAPQLTGTGQEAGSQLGTVAVNTVTPPTTAPALPSTDPASGDAGKEGLGGNKAAGTNPGKSEKSEKSDKADKSKGKGGK